MFIRIVACFIALCLIGGGATQASDLTTPDTAAELADRDAVVPDMQIPEPIVLAVIRHAIACELPGTTVPISRLHVTDAFRPPEA